MVVPMFRSPMGIMVAVVAMSLGRGDGEGCSAGCSGTISVAGSDGAQIQIWRFVLALVTLGPPAARQRRPRMSFSS